MIIVEFTASRPLTPKKHYFIGKDVSAILADTASGKEFGGARFSSYRVITLEEARTLGVGFLDRGIERIKRGTLSFKLDSPPSE